MQPITLNVTNSYLKKINKFDTNNISDGLSYGKLGLILFYLSQYEKSNDNYFLEKITIILEQIFENLQNNSEYNL